MSGVLIVAPTLREAPAKAAPTAIVGIGRGSEEATRKAIAVHSPSLMLSIGFNGALDPSLSTGDLVISEAVVAPTGERLALDPTLAELAHRNLMAVGLPVQRGGALTTDAPLATADAKSAQRSSSGAVVVDMETYWIAKAAADLRVPTLSVRTVVDEARDAIPRFAVRIIEDGGRNEVRHALRALLDPRNAGPMIRMARQARTATLSTKTMLSALLPELATNPTVEAVP